VKVDTAGNAYCGGPGGIYILDPKGKRPRREYDDQHRLRRRRLENAVLYDLRGDVGSKNSPQRYDAFISQSA
jgi:hypothetical protein